MDRNRLDAETQSHLIFVACRRRLPMATTPTTRTGVRATRLSFSDVERVKEWTHFVTAGRRRWLDGAVGRHEWGKKSAQTWCIPSAARPRHLCLISDERVQVRCRRKHRTFRLGKPLAAAVEARVALCPGYPRLLWLSRSMVRPACLAGRSRKSLAGRRDRDLSRGVGLSQTSYQSPEWHGLLLKPQRPK